MDCKRPVNSLKKIKKPAVLLLIMAASFLFGRGVAYVNYGKLEPQAKAVSGIALASENWGLGFGQEGSQPTGNVSAEELKKYDAYYVGGNSEKVIYLTFDAGYENGNTEAILDALKKHNVSATFFVVGHYLESAPELVKRMVKEGHTVGNHTYHHLDMSLLFIFSKRRISGRSSRTRCPLRRTLPSGPSSSQDTACQAATLHQSQLCYNRHRYQNHIFRQPLQIPLPLLCQTI